MKRQLLLLTILISFEICNAQKFDVDTLRLNGPVNKLINLKIVGDGFTAAEQAKFLTNAGLISNYFLGQAPISNYANYFNVVAIKVISNESGVKHPKTSSDPDCTFGVSNPDNYFGSTFDIGEIHRLVAGNNTKVSAIVMDNFPYLGQVLVLANSSHYGGSGGNIAYSTINSESYEIAVHEIGHSFANLADEYWAGDIYAGEKVNMTAETDPQKVKWKNWHGTSGIGIYKVGTHSSTKVDWYRPHQNCKMQYLYSPFCKVCAQAIIEMIHVYCRPVLEYSPSSEIVKSDNELLKFKLDKVLKPIPNTLNIKWNLDDQLIAENVDSVQVSHTDSRVSNGMHSLSVIVSDTTEMLRVDNHVTSHFQKITWKIDNAFSGIKSVKENKYSYTISPNPASDILNIIIRTEQELKTSAKILTVDGRELENVINNQIINGYYTKTVYVNHLPKGTYLLVFQSNGSVHTEKFVKK